MFLIIANFKRWGAILEDSIFYVRYLLSKKFGTISKRLSTDLESSSYSSFQQPILMLIVIRTKVGFGAKMTIASLEVKDSREISINSIFSENTTLPWTPLRPQHQPGLYLQTLPIPET